MAIDRSGKWWTGSEPADVEAYLTALGVEGYTVDETRLCQCGCGSLEFKLEADRNEGCAKRHCASCSAEHLICDSGEYWDDAEAAACTCGVCGGAVSNLAVGFSLYEAEAGQDRDVRWIVVGHRCVGCGTLGSHVDWKVAYGPSYQLLDQV